jgi:hemolysin activation/secretion protein
MVSPSGALRKTGGGSWINIRRRLCAGLLRKQMTSSAGRRTEGKPFTVVRWLIAGAIFSFFQMPFMANAQPVTPAQAIEEGLRRQVERTQDLQPRLPATSDLLKPQPGAPVSLALPVEQPCFAIKGVHLQSPDAARFSWLADAALPFLGQCAGVAGLRQIASALDAKLIELGYVTSRVTLPQQNLVDGMLVIRLHAGRVATIAMSGADAARAPDGAWGTWRNAFPTGTGDVLNLRDLEQGIEQMKRLPSQNVTTELDPGDEPDTSSVRILRKPAPLSERIRGGITADNSGNRIMGAAQLAGRIALDNPLGLNDIAALSASSNVHNPGRAHHSQSLAFDYSIPWGYNTFSFNAGKNRFAQVVQGTTVQFLSSGASTSAELKWHHTVVRTSAAKAGLYAAMSTRRASSYLDDVELIVQRRRTASLETGITWKQLLGEGSIEFELAYRQGMRWRHAQQDMPDAEKGGLTVRPDITLLNGVFRQPFKLAGRALQYEASVRAQTTHDVTLSVDQFAIGCRCSVRGFDGDSVLLAESGFYLRNELSMTVTPIDGVASAMYLGIDVGRVWGPSAVLLTGRKLAGAVVGVRAQWRQWQLDAALGTPLYKPEGFRTSRFSPYLFLTYAF